MQTYLNGFNMLKPHLSAIQIQRCLAIIASSFRNSATATAAALCSAMLWAGAHVKGSSR